MSEADEQMPLEIWTDINGNATRTQFKGGVKYIRADERDRLRKVIDDIRKKSYEPDPERPELSTRAQIQLMAEAALTPAGGGHCNQYHPAFDEYGEHRQPTGLGDL